MEVEAPRRAPSAQLVVEAEVGAAARSRAALDPPHQSPAAAVRPPVRLPQFVPPARRGLFTVSLHPYVTEVFRVDPQRIADAGAETHRLHG